MKTDTQTIPESIAPLLAKLISELRSLLGRNLHQVILYGSYSRGDFSGDSDIDVLVLTEGADVKNYNKLAAEISLRYLLEYGKLISLIFKDRNYYDNWKSTMDLFISVEEEGMVLV